MMNDVLFSLGLVNLVICVLVAVSLWIGNLRIRRLETVLPLSAEPFPSVSLVVAARNEERNIGKALQSLLEIDYPNLELMVVNDRSTDQTGAILDRMAEQNTRLKVFHLTELPTGWIGKNYALYFGATRAQGDFILFTDADVVLDPSVLRRAVGYAIRHDIDHLPALFQVRMPNWLLESFVVAFSIYFLTYFRPWNAPNPKSTAHVGVGGFNMIRANVYRAVGTHEAIRMRPDDDVKLGKIVKKYGFRQELLSAVDLMYVPWYESIRELIGGMEKNAFAGCDYSIFMTVFSSGAMGLFNVFPFIALFITSGWTQYVYLAVVATLLLMAANAASAGKMRRSCCFGFPIAACLFAFIQWRTMIVNLWSGGIRWRETHYPLSELKANRV